MKKWLFSIMLMFVFAMPLSVSAISDTAPSYHVDVTSSAPVDTVAHVAVRRTSKLTATNVNIKFKQPGDVQNCSSCHSAVQKTAKPVNNGISGGDPIGIRSY